MIPCWYCGSIKPGMRIREHQTPVCRGGTNHSSNLVPACNPCNGRKGNQTVEEFRQAFRHPTAWTPEVWSIFHPFHEIPQEDPQHGSHVFYGETHDVPKRWGEPFRVVCGRCKKESPLVRRFS